MRTKADILAFLDELIEQGQKVADYPALETLSFWNGRLLILKSLLGQALDPWSEALDRRSYGHEHDAVFGRLGAVKAIREAVDKGLLASIEDRALAEAMDDLLEQADYPIQKGYCLAAGVLGRAVLEEHLRKGCDRNSCLPTGRPTLSDLCQALYKGRHLDKLGMKRVDALTSVGNHCAHNVQPTLAPPQVETFLRDVREFVTRQQW